MKKKIIKTNKTKKDLIRYVKAYNILMDYYNELSIESRKIVDKELSKIKL